MTVVNVSPPFWSKLLYINIQLYSLYFRFTKVPDNFQTTNEINIWGGEEKRKKSKKNWRLPLKEAVMMFDMRVLSPFKALFPVSQHESGENCK